MEMIIGGAYQGKTEYARKQYPQLRWSDGGSVTEEELMNAQGVTGFQQYIRSELENGKDVSDLAEKIRNHRQDQCHPNFTDTKKES